MSRTATILQLAVRRMNLGAEQLMFRNLTRFRDVAKTTVR
jgi:hypothetical protein